MLDKISFQTNLFVQISQGDSDLTILPISFSFNFLAKTRLGPKFMYGDTQELKTEYLDLNLEVQPC